MKKTKIAATIAAAAILAACSGEKKAWELNGQVTNAPADTKLAVEYRTNLGWVTVDSIELSDDGSFRYLAPEGLPSHEIFRVTCAGKAVYFPIDSLETVTLTADAATFDTGYKLSGSPLAENMMGINRRISDAVRDRGVQYVLTDSAFRHDLATDLINDTTGIVSYYFLKMDMGGRPLFSLDNKFDRRVYGAVATRYQAVRPTDARAIELEQLVRQARSMYDRQGVTMEAQEIGYIDFECRDETGRLRRLSDTVNDAGITILSFTSYLSSDASPLLNTELKRLQELFAPQRLAIYQVALDDNEGEWTKVAINQPWTTVWAGSATDGNIRNYPLQTLPMTYIIDGNGSLVEAIYLDDLRQDDAAIEKAVRKHI